MSPTFAILFRVQSRQAAFVPRGMPAYQHHACTMCITIYRVHCTIHGCTFATVCTVLPERNHGEVVLFPSIYGARPCGRRESVKPPFQLACQLACLLAFQLACLLAFQPPALEGVRAPKVLQIHGLRLRLCPQMRAPSNSR